MELMVIQLATIVRELEEHKFWNIVEVLAEDHIDSVVKMVCLAKTISCEAVSA